MTLIVIVTVAAYAGSFRGGFVSDDVQVVVEEPRLRSLAPENLRVIATTFDGPNYMPLKVLSMAIDYQLWGLEPAGYHWTNLLMHAANALLVYWILWRMGETAGAALAVALLWAVHPVQAESVAWICERKNVLSTLCFFAAFLLYLDFSDRPRASRYGLIVVLYVCALLSKINTIVLPAVMLLYEVAERSRLRSRDVWAALPMFAIGAVLAWVNLAGNPSHGVAYHGGSLAVTMRASSTVVLRYLGLIAAPVGLSSYYPVTLRASWLELPVIAAVAVIAGCILAALALVVRRRPGGFWILWFFVTLSPMLNVVPFPALMADRYLYVPLLGPLVLLVRGVCALALRLSAPARALPAVTAGAVAACVALTATRIPVWHDELSLWADWAVRFPYISADRPFAREPRVDRHRILRDALARDGNSAALHNNIGALAFEENRLDEAIDMLIQARALDPRDSVAALNLGRAYLFAGRPSDAVRALEDAVRLEPPSFFAHLNLGRAYLQLGDVRRARAALEHARELRKDQPQFWQRDWAVLEQLERGRRTS